MLEVHSWSLNYTPMYVLVTKCKNDSFLVSEVGKTKKCKTKVTHISICLGELPLNFFFLV